ncbi:glycosyltransferase family 2 protein [Bosea sp. 2RAB26]|uniref:glycosyltransferase family 2 protein n=1 Tax=Bosea sp. 2RAB26 TaxID=3237476 RepID=UPI003F92D334
MKVSICIPAYRQVQYLRSTLISLVQQDYQDFELILSDDSPDRQVQDLLSEFTFGERCRYVRNAPSLGSPENWNAAVRMARGDYIKMLHHDDGFIRPDALRQFVHMLDEHPHADFAFAASRVDHVDAGRQRIHRATPEQVERLRTEPATLFLGNCIGAPSATIVRRGIGLDYDRRMKWLVDIDFYYRVLMQNGNFAWTPEALINTTADAPHQVTEECHDNAQVELGEAMMMFVKLTPAQRALPEIRRRWQQLFDQFRIQSVEQLRRLGMPDPIDPAIAEILEEAKARRAALTIAHVGQGPRRILNSMALRTKALALGPLYRVYPFLPSSSRRLIKRIVGILGLR